MQTFILSSHQTLADCLCASIRQRLPYSVEVADELPDDGPHHPTRLFMVDLSYPIAGLRQLVDPSHGSWATAKILLLGFDPGRDPDAVSWLETDVDGVLPVDAGLEDMIETVERVVQGEKVFPPSVAYLLYERLAQKSHEATLQRRMEALTLTRRELEVLRLVGERRSNDAIAGRLGISIHTVKNHVHNILDKLDVENRVSAADLARRRGWLHDEPLVEVTSSWTRSASC